MLKIEALQYLICHATYLRNVFKGKDIFFVWGIVRDLLLWFGTTPIDIDITCAWNPDDMYQSLKSPSYHLFRTEKFGTITLIPKTVELPDYEEDTKIQYELTPLRTEWWYADFRHPDEIKRSDNVVADSKRRDFSINAMYVYVPEISYSSILSKIPDSISTTRLWANESAVLTLTKHEDILKCFPDGIFDAEACAELLQESEIVSFSASREEYADTLLILVDPHQGFQALQSKTLATVGNPHHRFWEDALRILRGVRFVNTLNHSLFHWPYARYTPHEVQQNKENTFDIANETRDAMKKNYYLVSHVAKERIKDEVTKVFRKWSPFGYIALLKELNLLKFIFPAFEATRNVEQPVRYHAFDVYSHTLLVLHALCPENDDYLVRLAGLYHDVGKTDQYYYFSQHISKEEKKLPITHQMYHAQSLGPVLAAKDFKALGFSTKEIDTICRYIAYHHRPGELLETAPENKIKKLRLLLSEVGPEMLLNLLDIAVADRRGQFNPLQPPATAELYLMKEEVKRLYEEEGRFTTKDLAVDGNIVMQELNLSPWPQVGDMLQKAFQRVITDPGERNSSPIILSYLKSLPKS